VKKKQECTDKNCAIHGKVRGRGRVFTGVVRSAKMQRTITFEFERRYYLPKYQRYEKRKTRVKAHNPDCINAKEGNTVRIMECRPLSKTKKFVVIEQVS
jgi:small subunit ribosomal protein S17